MRGFRDFWLGEADLAPAALLRILYGLLLFNWFWQLYPNLTAFFTDEGFMPRRLLFASFGYRAGLLDLSGDWWWVALCWLASLAVAVMLTVGYRTRTASVLAFVAVASFSWRNPLILDGSDFVFRAVPLWLAFTNVGDKWSLDAVRRRARGDPPSGRGPALPIRILELQIAWIYLATGLEKSAGHLWAEGTAPYYALQLKYTFGRAYVEPLARNDVFDHLVSWWTMAVELGFLPAAFLPFFQPRLRVVAVLAAASLHVGILTMMNVGNFPVIMLVTLVVFLPAAFIERAIEWAGRFFRWRHVRLHVPLALVQAIPGRSAVPSPAPPAPAGRRRSPARAVGTLALGAFAALSFATAFPSSMAAYRPSGPLNGLLVSGGFDQRWDMFSPDPTRADGWMRGPAVLSDGSEIDLFKSEPPYDGPRYADPLYSRWVKVFERIPNAANSVYRLEFAQMFCRLRNVHLASGQPRLVSFKIFYTERLIGAPGRPDTFTDHDLWSQIC